MTVRHRIAILVCLAVLAALIVGGGALIALHRTGAQVEAIYHDSLKPILSVVAVRAEVHENQDALYRALAVGTVDAANAADKENRTIAQDMNALWNSYYPAMVSSPDEKAKADRFIAARTLVTPLIPRLESLMEAGKHNEAAHYMLATVQPGLTAESKAIEAIVDENEHEADASFAASEALERKSITTFVAVMLGVALVLVLVGTGLAKSIIRPLIRARDLASRISSGEIGHRLVVTGSDEVSETLRSLAQMDESLAGIVRKVRQNASQVSESARQIADGNADLASRTQEQASSLEETAAAMEEMTASVRQNADGSAAAQARSQRLRGEADAARQVALEANEAMARITEASDSIAEMAVLVDEIAFQTNLLALNAAVEAARAGDQGRGFAVVAVEVRRLAQRSATAAKSIKELVASTSERVSHGAALVTSTAHTLDGMSKEAVQVSDALGEIAAASIEQATGISQVNDSVASIDIATQQNAALVEQASAASFHSLQLADDLMREVAFFRIDDAKSENAAASFA